MSGFRVLVNGFRALPATEGAGGAGKFFEALLTGIAPHVSLRVIASSANRSSLPNDRRIEYVIVDTESQEQYASQFDWADIYYDPLNGLGPALIPPRLPVVSAIMDLQHNVYPRFFSQATLEARNRAYRFAIGRADGVITISEFERENIRRVYGTEHVYVVHLSGYTSESGKGVDLIGRARTLSTGPYLVYPAIPWRHKNHYRLLEAVSIIRRDIPDFRLLLTGIEKHGASTGLHTWKIVAEQLEDTVEVQGHLSQSEFAARIAGARGLVFPSLYEGFGIPVVEAMQMGVPVLAVRETAIPEVAGDAVEYFDDPRNSARMAEDLRRFWLDDELRANAAERGRKQGQKFSRQRFVEETLSVLRDVHERRSQAPSASATSWNLPRHDELKTEKPLTAFVLVEATGDAVQPHMDYARAMLNERLPEGSPRCFVVDRSVPVAVLQKGFAEDESYALADISDNDEIALALRFFCESVLTSTYCVYTRTGNMLSAGGEAVRTALRTLDYMDDAGCALLDAANRGWTVVSPASTEAEASAIQDMIRPRRLAFFENLIIRSRLLDTGGPIGSMRLLSALIRSVKYLSGPAQ